MSGAPDVATFPQVLRSKAQGRRQLWYIHGSEPSVVQDAYELAQEHVNSLNLEVSKRVFLGGETSLYELEAELGREAEGDRQLVVLLNAHEFTQWPGLAPVLQGAGKERFFIAVGEEAPSDSVREIFINSTKSRFVVCNALSEADQLTWVSSRLNVTSDAARRLVQQAGGDHSWLLNQIRKLERVPSEVASQVTDSLVKVLCTTRGHANFVDALTLGNKLSTVLSIESAVPTNSELAALARRVLQYALIEVATERAVISNRLLVEMTGLSQQEISVFRPRAVHYDGKATTRRYTALVNLYDGLLRGSLQSYFALVTRW